jgi:hypothetical protein
MTVLTWLIVVIAVAQTNMVGFSSTTLHWSNLQQPNASFRWSSAPTEHPVRITPDVTKTMKVTIPRAFSTATLFIETTAGDGRLFVAVDAPAGRTMHTASTAAGTTLQLPLRWEDTAMSNRTFSVSVSSIDTFVQLSAMKLTLNR